MPTTALPRDFLSIFLLKKIQFQAQIAAAAYSRDIIPRHLHDVDLKSIGIPQSYISGVFFVNGNAAARLLTDGKDYYLSFRGTDDLLGDAPDYRHITDKYYEKFAVLIDATQKTSHMKQLYVTGHSLGSAASHQLSEAKSKSGSKFSTASYYSFSSPTFQDANNVASFGFANDKIYGIATTASPPFVDQLFWFTNNEGINRAVQGVFRKPLEAHSIQNQIEAIDRIIKSDALNPEYGLVKLRGLPLDTNVIISGTHKSVQIPNSYEGAYGVATKLNGTVVFLGLDGGLSNDSKSKPLSNSDHIIGRNNNSYQDWIDGIGGNDNIQGRAGDDHLFGGTGNDILIGGDGNDVLVGGEGRDTLIGGWGSDTYIISDLNDIIVETYEPSIRNIDSLFFKSGGKLDFKYIEEYWYVGKLSLNCTVVDYFSKPSCRTDRSAGSENIHVGDHGSHITYVNGDAKLFPNLDRNYKESLHIYSGRGADTLKLDSSTLTFDTNPALIQVSISAFDIGRDRIDLSDLSVRPIAKDTFVYRSDFYDGHSKLNAYYEYDHSSSDIFITIFYGYENSDGLFTTASPANIAISIHSSQFESATPKQISDMMSHVLIV